MIKSIVGFILVAGCGSYLAFTLIGTIVEAQVEAELNKVIARDKIAVGVHNLSGMAMVPSTCHTLSVKAENVDVSNYVLLFTTWEDSARVCKEEPTPRQFHVTLFAPSTGVAFQATLDGKPISLIVMPEIQ
jgi:hypothetical protein